MVNSTFVLSNFCEAVSCVQNLAEVGLAVAGDVDCVPHPSRPHHVSQPAYRKVDIRLHGKGNSNPHGRSTEII